VSGSRETLAWYLRRLRAMTPAELVWRAGRIIRARGLPPRVPSALSSRGGAGLRAFQLLDPAVVRRVATEHPDEAGAVVALAEKFLRHEFRFFGNPEASLGVDIDWSYDPISNYRWPLAPSRAIDYKFNGQDPKWVWELNRLQHLPLLVEAWMISGDHRFAEGAIRDLRSWIAANPFDRGVAWSGGFEAGVRAMSVAFALRGLRHYDGLDVDTESVALEMLSRSAVKSWSERSLFSSANNHLIGEMGGLAITAILFPELPSSERDEGRALKILIREADRQILPDGSGVEQSLRYHLFTADVLLLVVASIRERGGSAPATLVNAVERSARFLESLVHEGESAPWYGDDDESFALRLQTERCRGVHAHLSSVRAVLGRPTAPARDDFAAALLRHGLSNREGVTRGSSSAPMRSFVAPDAGLVVLRNASGHRSVVDVGRLGQPPIAAHGHADALAVSLHVNGVSVVVDPGTGSYYRHSAWREAHRSTRLHATVEVDGENQSLAGGRFMWARHAGVQLRHVDLDLGLVEAEHDGYRRLADPVTHRRWVIAPPDEDDWLVVDWCSAASRHDFRVGWPLSAQATVERTDLGHVVEVGAAGRFQFAYASSSPLTPFASRGDDEAHIGWFSAHLEERVPAWHVGTLSAAEGPWAHVTAVRALGGTRPPVEHLSVRLLADRIEIRRAMQNLSISLEHAGRISTSVVDSVDRHV
jgi:hypothetical protein